MIGYMLMMTSWLTMISMALDFARIVKVKPGDGHVHLKAWRERLAARPSVGPAPGR